MKAANKTNKYLLGLALLFSGLVAASSLLPINYAFLAWLVLLVVSIGVITNFTGVQSKPKEVI